MAGAGLIAIKRRIKSIGNTKKITKAMGLVATAKLRKSRIQLSVNEKYYNSFKEIMEEVLDNHEEESIFTKGNKSNKKLYITITSDTGLCGGYNNAVVSRAIEDIKKDRENSIVTVVGQKGRGYFRRYKIDTTAEFVSIPDLPTLTEARTVYNHALDLYLRGEVGEIYVAYTKFVSTVKQETIVEKILPFDKKANSNYSDDYVKLEPTAEEVLENIVGTFLCEKILNVMLNSKASEQALRMAAMDGATKNADDLLEKLNLQYNRVRQSVITQEISEIVSGAEAQK